MSAIWRQHFSYVSFYVLRPQSSSFRIPHLFFLNCLMLGRTGANQWLLWLLFLFLLQLPLHGFVAIDSTNTAKSALVQSGNRSRKLSVSRLRNAVRRFCVTRTGKTERVANRYVFLFFPVIWFSLDSKKTSWILFFNSCNIYMSY